jgi:glycosyltransferase involved in cell wall biosynthesis
MPPCVSVIIPVYNTEPCLRQCLDSVVNQTLSDTEIICINDGSTDNSLSILEEYAKKDSRIKVITKENGGNAAPARNLGLEIAQGEFLLFLDSDDFFELDMLECLVNRAKECEADVVLCNGDVYNHITGQIQEHRRILNSKYLPLKDVFCYKDYPQRIFEISGGAGWNKLYRHLFLRTYNLKFQNIKITDDVYFNYMHMVLAKRISVVNKKLVHYRKYTGSSQIDNLVNYPDSSHLPHIEIMKTLLEFGIYQEVKQSHIQEIILSMRYTYSIMNSFEKIKYLHDKYRNQIFKELDILGQPQDFFYDKNLYLWCRQIIENSAEELLFQASKQYGHIDDFDITAVLRFKFPYELIEKDSKIILYGKGNTGKYYYVQALLSGYCRIVLWLENPKQMEMVDYDKILIAYASEELISKAKNDLLELGVPEDKIVSGL